MEYYISSVFDESAEVVRQAGRQLADRVAQAVELMVGCYRSGGGLLVFGNGGSAADAQHMVAELVGRLMFDRPPLKAEALSANTSSLTCLANDYSYDSVFARQIEANGLPADVAVAITTSGNSANVVAGLAKARQMGMKTIALTGPGGGKCAELADVLLDVRASHVPARIQEAHAVIYHVMCQLVEARIFGNG